MEENAKSKSALIFLDLEKAFDTVPRNKLINKLKHLQIPGWIVNIIISIFLKTEITLDGKNYFK